MWFGGAGWGGVRHGMVWPGRQGDSMKLLFILLGIGGLAAVSYGCWLIYSPLGFIIPGILIVMLAQTGYNSIRKRGR